MAKNPYIATELEETAGYYSPSYYTGLAGNVHGLLSHFHDLEISADSASSYFTALPARADKRNVKLFAVGVLPPSANVTFKVLDRSASIAPITGLPGATVDDSAALSGGGTSAYIEKGLAWGEAAKQLKDEFWIAYVGMCRRIGVDPVELAAVLYCESGFDPTKANYGGSKERETAGRPVAVGLGQMIWSSAKSRTSLTEDAWRDLPNQSAETQLTSLEEFMSRGYKGKKRNAIYQSHFGGYGGRNSNGAAYVTKEYAASHPGTYPELDRQQKACEQNAQLVKDGYIAYSTLYEKIADKPPQFIRDKIAAAEAALGSEIPPRPGKGDGKTKNDWNAKKDAAEAAQKNRAEAVPLNDTELGKKLRQAQVLAISEAYAYLESMARTPPLRLLVNPEQFSVKCSKLVSDGNWSRRGPILEFFGDEQDTISASGKVAGFYTLETGLTRAARQFSQSWRNLQSLYLLYKNNGGVYLPDPFDKTGVSKRLTYVGSVYIYYDGVLYIGSFSSFNLTENDSANFTAEYSFDFTVRSAFILDQPPSGTSRAPGIPTRA